MVIMPQQRLTFAMRQALGRLLRGILLLPLSVAVIVLVIIGLINLDLLIAIIPRLIAAIVVVGVFVMILKRMLLPR